MLNFLKNLAKRFTGAKKSFPAVHQLPVEVKKTQPEKICPTCGKTFTPNCRRKNYCSKECSKLGRPKKIPAEKTCPNCGKKFIPRSGHKEQKFCSRSCAGGGRPRKTPVEKTCPNCGKKFVPCKKSQKFCSRECYVQNIHANKKKFAEKTCPTCGNSFVPTREEQIFCSMKCSGGRPAKTPVEKTCPTCGKKFIPRSGHKEQKFCSKSCSAILHHKQILGEKTCPVCGKTFLAHLGQVFCSKDCLKENRRQSSIATPTQKPIFEKTCPVCGKTFTSSDPRRIYCSSACAQKNYYLSRIKRPPEEKTCSHCGKKFSTTNPQRVFCSDKCRKAACKKRGRERKPPIEKICPVCGKTFLAKSNSRIYCSDECKNYLADQQKKLRGNEPVEKTCPTCGKTFKPDYRHKVYCSDYCWQKSLTLKNHGRHFSAKCQECGAFFDTSVDALDGFCSDECRNRANRRAESTEEKKKKSLDDWMREAKECGMSYGNYRAAIERLGKTYEELRL